MTWCPASPRYDGVDLPGLLGSAPGFGLRFPGPLVRGRLRDAACVTPFV